MLAPGAVGRVLSRALSLSHGSSTVVVERVWAVPLSRSGSPPRLHSRRFRVFRLLRDGKHRPRGELELLLTRSVQDLGSRGDLVRVSKALGRNRLLPQGLAVYPSPENLQRFQQEQGDFWAVYPSPENLQRFQQEQGDFWAVYPSPENLQRFQQEQGDFWAVYPSPENLQRFQQEQGDFWAVYPSPENLQRFQQEQAQQEKLEEPQTQSGQKTLEFLRRCRLEVGMKNNQSWELSPEIVARHFLKNLRVFVPPHALRLPPEPITRWGHFWCDVTVNGLDTVRVPMDVVQFMRPKTKRFRHWQEQQRRQLESSRERLL